MRDIGFQGIKLFAVLTVATVYRDVLKIWKSLDFCVIPTIACMAKKVGDSGNRFVEAHLEGVRFHKPHFLVG